MTNNRKLISVIIILLLASLACSVTDNFGNSSSDDPADSPPQANQEPQSPLSNLFSDCKNPLYPVKEGATWTFAAISPMQGTLTRSILAVSNDGFTDQDVFNDVTSRTGNWNCDDGDLISLDLTVSNIAAATGAGGGMELTFETTSLDGVTLPAVVKEGTSWSQNLVIEGTQMMDDQEMISKFDITNDCTAIGEESVTVPAGTFKAQRVDCVSTVVITMSMGDMEISPTTAAGTTTTWYAEGVGMIKTESDAGDGIESSLELTSYDIP